MVRLNKKYNSFSAEKAENATESEIASTIIPVGFYNTKSKNIIKVGKICAEKYGGDIPDNITELTALPGIGPKMGFLVSEL